MTTPPWPSPVPELVLLTDRAQLPPGRDLTAQVAAAVGGGARAVVLREKDLARDQRRRLADELLGLLRPVGGVLLVASDVTLAREVGADGVHLAAADPGPVADDTDPSTNPHGGPDADGGSLIVGRSAHDLDELLVAQAERAGYATCSPIFASASKPGYGPALGLDGLRAAASRVLVPIYALGGITPANTAACRTAGAAGVAVMGEVMRAHDPASVVADLLAVLHGTARSAPGIAPAAAVEPPSVHRIGARP
ncbi:MAG: thiamine phosphate synthase [Acidimicrobiales bacterium]